MTVLLISQGRAESLPDAWKIALDKNRGLNAARAQTGSAEQNLLSARSARFPRITAEGDYTLTDNTAEVSLPLPGLPVARVPLLKDENFFVGRAAITVPLFTSGRISSGIDSALSGLDSSRAEESRILMDTKMSVAEAYVAVLRARHGAGVAESHVKSLEAHERDVASLFDKGLVAKNDLLSVRVSLSDARETAIRHRNALDLARDSYNHTLGRSLDHPFDLEDLSPEPVEGNVTALISQAVSSRPEIKALAGQTLALRFRAEALTASLLPQITATGAYNVISNTILEDKDIWSLTMGLRWEIFDGGVKRHEADAILKQAEALEILKDDLASSISVQVRSAWRDLEATRLRMDVTEETVSQAEENLRVTKDRYKNGIGTNTEVLDAETLRVRSQANRNSAVYDAVLAGLRLRRATGEL